MSSANGHAHQRKILTPDEIAALPEEHLPFKLEDHSVDESRPFRVVVIGAGLSGIYAGIRIPATLKNVDLTIYDKNADFGGTWYENRYIGCACDIPAHCYQYSFEPNPNWSSFYAPASEICAYWKSVALKYGVPRYTKLSHQVVGSRYDEKAGMWDLEIKNLGTDEVFADRANAVIQAVGGLNAWKWPDQPGLHDFKGHLVHSAVWDQEYDFKGKKVALIGSGSTAIQIMPELQPVVARIDQYVRGPTWIGFPFLAEEVADRNPSLRNFQYSEEEKATFGSDVEAAMAYRQRLMRNLNGIHAVTMKDSEMQKGAMVAFAENMRTKLVKKPEIAQALQPTFPAGCRRLTPGPGYFEALVEDNVEFVTTHINRIVDKGIVDKSGNLREYDAIVCATGFNTTYRPRFPLIGRNGVLLADKWADFPSSYCSVAVDGFPNYFLVNGPNSAVGSGDLVILFQAEVDYAVQCIKKLQMHHYKSMEVKKQAVEEFQEYAQTYFRKTVFSTKCPSWYKAGKSEGPVSGLWPGSTLHGVATLSSPRWEDFDFERLEGPSRLNRFHWLGDGWTTAEHEPSGEGDVAWYLTQKGELMPMGQTAPSVHGAGASKLIVHGVEKK